MSGQSVVGPPKLFVPRNHRIDSHDGYHNTFSLAEYSFSFDLHVSPRVMVKAMMMLTYNFMA